MTAPDPITRVVETNLCTGCGACAGRFPELIRMVEDPANGRRPVVSSGAEGRQAAEAAMAVCAGVGADHAALPARDEIDATWGPVLMAWEGWAADGEIRFRGSSGGAVTALALSMLESGEATGVAHVAQREDDPRLNKSVISRTRAELLRGAGSRYAQASPAERLGEIASVPGRYAFVGKPCDVASVAKATRANRMFAEKIAATISIFCAGAPTLAATDKLLDRLAVPKDATLTDLRYRGDGWPGMMQARYRDAAGEIHQSEAITYGEGWGTILQASRKWRCRICADHTGEFADISVGDPWHNPPKGNTDAGRSLIVARTPRGVAIVEEAIRRGILVAEPRPRGVIAEAQPNLLETRGAVFGRRLAMRLVGLALPRDRGLNSGALWLRHLTMKARVQSVAGSLKRILRYRLWRSVRITAR
ncbi:MAG: coenzyme F420 hydrogenase [Alphaproteobacteria bacterium]|nr:MAG: coenzyme F420 hydrogenase [Alphaproteobacteria bacterium]